MKRIWILCIVGMLLWSFQNASAQSVWDAMPDSLELPEMGVSVTLDAAWKEMVYADQLMMLLGYTLDDAGVWMDTMTLDLFYCPAGITYDNSEEYPDWLAKNGMLLARLMGGRTQSLQAQTLAQQYPKQAIQWLPGSDPSYRYALITYEHPSSACAEDEACLEAIAMALDRPMTLFQLQSPVPFAAEPDTEGLSSGLCTGFSTLDFDDQPVTDAIFAQAKLTLVHVWGISCIPNLKDLQTMDEIARVYAPQGVQVLGVPCDITFSDGTRNAQAFKDARALASQAKAHHRQLVPDAVLHRMLQETTIVPTVYFVDAKGCLLGPGITGSREWSEWITLLDAALQSTLEESEPAGGA